MSDGLTSEKPGLKAALDALQPTNAPVPGSAASVQQLPLLPLCQVVPDGENAEPDLSPRGAGRPLGSRNKSTKEWRDYILSRFHAPLVVLAETYSRRPQDIARELGFTDVTAEQLLDIFKIQLQCAKELAPYVHQKQPLAIEGGENGLMTLIINAGRASADQVEKAGVLNLNFIDNETQQNQSVSVESSENSVVSHSDASGQASETVEESNV